MYYILGTCMKKKKRQLVNDGIWNFEHRQTADDDEGMDLCKKKNRCCRVPPA